MSNTTSIVVFFGLQVTELLLMEAGLYTHRLFQALKTAICIFLVVSTRSSRQDTYMRLRYRKDQRRNIDTDLLKWTKAVITSTASI